MHNFSGFLNFTLHVSDGLSVHRQESKSVHTASSVCHNEIPKMDKITTECMYTQSSEM